MGVYELLRAAPDSLCTDEERGPMATTVKLNRAWEMGEHCDKTYGYVGLSITYDLKVWVE
jgi:hypothetical protein